MTYSDITGGFGDALDPSEIIPEFDAWLHSRAHVLLYRKDHPDHEDLVQEGRVAMWQAIGNWERKAALPHWLTINANWRMKECVVRHIWTGMPPRLHGRQPLEHREPVSLDDLMGDGDSVIALLEAVDLMDDAVWAYHQGEIAQAIDHLSPQQRRYVVMRFWGGLNTTELKQLFGYDPNSLWYSVKNGARLKLRSSLQHLVSA